MKKGTLMLLCVIALIAGIGWVGYSAHPTFLQGCIAIGLPVVLLLLSVWLGD